MLKCSVADKRIFQQGKIFKQLNQMFPAWEDGPNVISTQTNMAYSQVVKFNMEKDAKRFHANYKKQRGERASLQHSWFNVTHKLRVPAVVYVSIALLVQGYNKIIYTIGTLEMF